MYNLPNFYFNLFIITFRACLFVWLVGFLTSSSTTSLYRGWNTRLASDNFTCVLPHTRQSGETMTSVSAGHIIRTPTQPVRSGRPQRGSNPGSPHQESRPPPHLRTVPNISRVHFMLVVFSICNHTSLSISR